MIKHNALLAVALCSAMLALPAVAAAPLGSSWADITKLPDFFTGNWQSMSSFLDNPTKVPFTAQAQAYIAHYKPIEDIPFAGPSCKTPGMPIIQRLGSPLKFFYEPGMIAIYIENSSMTRFIKLNGKHSARPNPTFLGESVGHFEGDTLVVDSVGFDDILLQYGDLPGKGTGPFVLPPEVIFGPHGPNLRMVERIRLTRSGHAGRSTDDLRRHGLDATLRRELGADFQAQPRGGRLAPRMGVQLGRYTHFRSQPRQDDRGGSRRSPQAAAAAGQALTADRGSPGPG